MEKIPIESANRCDFCVALVMARPYHCEQSDREAFWLAVEMKHYVLDGSL